MFEYDTVCRIAYVQQDEPEVTNNVVCQGNGTRLLKEAFHVYDWTLIQNGTITVTFKVSSESCPDS